ncbi:MAG TPA: protein kinase, partial [Candidatus Acidoferrum sp.]|nr:protein kinase [Candidatus Acidoferrum sp.]
MIDGRGQVIIMDFGLAGLAEQLQGDIRSGTPAYMSPEQLAGTEVTVRSDIYALGLVMYEIFTGRRAFEAASLIELMQMQERAAPQSISTVVREMDPAVERVVMRCLQPDARQRPASALAVSAGLPGGDPLAAALAAGETPSPDLVAAAGETEGLAPRTAIAWIAAVVVLLGVVMVLGPRVSITSRLNLENSPDALSRDARTHIRSFGYTAKPVDSDWGLTYNDEYSRWLTSHPKEAAQRWANPGAGQPPFLKFWYRQSPQPMFAVRQFNTSVGYNDPPMEQSGAVRIETDPDGRMIRFEAVPPQVEEAGQPPAPAVDWNLLFHAAGLDPAAFHPAEATWTPLVSWDARSAWTGTDPVTGANLRVEAAAWRGRPVFFEIVGPWTPRNRMSGAIEPIPVARLVLIYLCFVAAGFLAWHNLRSGKADRRGALRIALLYFCFMTAGNLLRMHHTATQNELAGFWMNVGGGLVNAGLTWVFYIALEPWVRKKWPRTMISWTRYTAEGASDPLVGRDLLYGIVLGAGLTVVTFLRPVLPWNDGKLVFPPLDPLRGMRPELAAILHSVPDGILSALLLFFLLFVLRLLLRREWIAGIVFVVLMAATTATTTPAVDYPLNMLAYGIFAFALLRYGLLAAIVASAIDDLIELGGVLDFSSWSAGNAAVPFVLVLILAIYGFRKSLGGRPLWTP